jgi:hypothetical protein
MQLCNLSIIDELELETPFVMCVAPQGRAKFCTSWLEKKTLLTTTNIICSHILALSIYLFFSCLLCLGIMSTLLFNYIAELNLQFAKSLLPNCQVHIVMYAFPKWTPHCQNLDRVNCPNEFPVAHKIWHLWIVEYLIFFSGLPKFLPKNSNYTCIFLLSQPT